jgi:hypothetical protein
MVSGLINIFGGYMQCAKKTMFFLTAAMAVLIAAGCAGIPKDPDADEISVQAAGTDDRADRIKWKAVSTGTTAAVTGLVSLLTDGETTQSVATAVGAGALLGLSYASFNQMGPGCDAYNKGFIAGFVAAAAGTAVFMVKNPGRYNGQNGLPVLIYMVDGLAGIVAGGAAGGVTGEVWDFIAGLFQK